MCRVQRQTRVRSRPQVNLAKPGGPRQIKEMVLHCLLAEEAESAGRGNSYNLRSAERRRGTMCGKPARGAAERRVPPKTVSCRRLGGIVHVFGVTLPRNRATS